MKAKADLDSVETTGKLNINEIRVQRSVHKAQKEHINARK